MYDFSIDSIEPSGASFTLSIIISAPPIVTSGDSLSTLAILNASLSVNVYLFDSSGEIFMRGFMLFPSQSIQYCPLGESASSSYRGFDVNLAFSSESVTSVPSLYTFMILPVSSTSKVYVSRFTIYPFLDTSRGSVFL